MTSGLSRRAACAPGCLRSGFGDLAGVCQPERRERRNGAVRRHPDDLGRDTHLDTTGRRANRVSFSFSYSISISFSGQ